jgi:hypothetical protein
VKREVYTGFWWGNLRERDHLKDPDVDGKIIKNGFSRRGIGGMDWVDLGEDMSSWRAFVNAVMKFKVP